MTYVPESFRHLVELSCKDTKVLIDDTPIRNYGVSRGDTINVEAPQFKKSGLLIRSASDDPVLDNGYGTEGSMGLEGKVERDERRAEFSSELRQRAMVESGGDQKAPATSNPQDVREEIGRKRYHIHEKTKTGCLTCRERRIKCDEGRPICSSCIESKRDCEGYYQHVIFGGSMGTINGVPVPEIESDLEITDTRDVSGPIPLSAEADQKVEKSSTPGVRCLTCALEGKDIWVLSGRCCRYCGTPCGDEDTLDVRDSFSATGVNDNSEERLPSIPEGPKNYQVTCPSLLSNGCCRDRTECPFTYGPAMIPTLDLCSELIDIVEYLPGTY